MYTFGNRYELLNQKLDDDDEVDDDFELDIFKENKRRHRNRKIKLRFCKRMFYLLISLFVLVTFIYVLYKYNQVALKELPKIFSSDYDNSYWTLKLDSHGTESCIKTYDIDQDGLDDIIFGLAETESIDFNADSHNSEKRYDGFMVAIRGKDGKILYKIPTKSEVFEINCHSIDINKDGKYDCVASGRRRTFLAFNPLDGKVFWDSSYMIEINDIWNIYMPIILPYDFDNDGVSEIIISTGGNPSIPSDKHDREPGFILMISGRTGLIIGDVFVFPSKKETYMSPVLHTQKDNSSYLLLGDGGETVYGSLYIISLPDFYDYIIKSKAEKNLSFKGEYKSNKILENNFKKDKQIDKLFTLHESLTKGVMVPPVLVDVNNDGSNDIFILTFDGQLVMKDGETFLTIWSKKFECYETYTSPAPGYWNDDDIIDFMLIINLGTFDYYIKSSILVINGRNGDIIWKMDAPRMEMVSPLSIQTLSFQRDLFFFRAQGLGHDLEKNSMQQVFHGIEPQQPIDKNVKSGLKRSYDSELNEKAKESLARCEKLIRGENNFQSNQSDYHEKLNKPTCENKDFNNVYLTTYGFLVDRSTQKSPLLIFKSTPETIVHSYFDKQTNMTETQCVVLEPMERNTGAIGHFSNKNELDIINIVTYGGIVRDKNGNYVKILSNIKIDKFSIKYALNQKKQLENTVYEYSIKFKDERISNKKNDESIENLKFKENQIWSSYMGIHSDSSFTMKTK